MSKGANKTGPMPGVKNSMAGTFKGAPKGVAPSAGNTKRGMQGGTTNPSTDAGGGVGNSSEALHKMLGGKC